LTLHPLKPRVERRMELKEGDILNEVMVIP
jgi:hypothetical protein